MGSRKLSHNKKTHRNSHSFHRNKGKNNPNKKLTHFTSEGQPEIINKQGLALEKENMRAKNILFGIFAFVGIILCLFDIRDKGMTLEIMGFFNYSGSLIGVVIAVLSVCGIWCNNPQITIKK